MSSPRGPATLIAAALLLAQAQQSPAQSYAVEGPGRTSCAAFRAMDTAAPELRETAAWLTGYLTAHHRLMPEIFDLSPWQTPGITLGLIRQFCSAQPDASVERAAQELVRYLAPGALTEPSEFVAMRNGDQITVLYEAVLAQVRDALADAGIPPGTEDAELANALTAFQTARGLPVTGLPDQRTLATLLGSD
ncbi:peptidoglycan-binding domain-containing protein [Poseidonocella sedimentorum]|uniref:Putative peptidoglycan binding domain-containing protein n=1 Tax=Poseidonocella sedimentorum TaxID=871652 RepID=A0A1I6D9G8_9RHOB|nr:peptidoglycan-binding domain-containing protein [Poseidonocella sedimentorum]SFR02048.1 Putative peptidoglycan binding domain-containing protein [Poseidonocella sedimentorum]